MKHHQLLFTTVLVALIFGCGEKAELTPQEKAMILKRNEARKQKAKEDYMFSLFDRTEGTDQYSKIDYTIIDESTQKPSSEKRGGACNWMY
jgi:hypothetical protein